MACVYVHHIGFLPPCRMPDTSAEVEAVLFPSTPDCTGDTVVAQCGGERIGSRRQFHLEPFGLGGRLWRRSERCWKAQRRSKFVSH